MKAIKFADPAKTALDILLVPFGGSVNGRDTSGEYFSAKTNLCLDWFPDGRRPLLWHHGLDSDLKTTPVGYIESIEVKADGAWARAQLDAHNEYYGEIAGLIDQDAVGASSGAMAHLVQKNKKTGHIDQWPLVEGSITPTPCEPLLATVDFATAKAHFQAIGADLPDRLETGIKAVWSTAMQNKLPDSSFLYIESGGTTDEGGKTTPRSLRHFPVRAVDGALDTAHVENALSRIPQSTLPQAVKDKALAKARKYATSLGMDAGGDATKAAAAAIGVCAQCMADNEAGCLCTCCVDGDPEACLCDLARYGMDAPPVPAVDPAPPTALRLDGCYEDRIQDIRDAVNQSGPMATYGYNSLLGTFADYAIVCRYEWDDDGPGDQTYWKIPYTLTGDGPDAEPVLDMTRAQLLEQVYLPVGAKSAPVSLALDAHALSQHAKALLQRTEGLHERRIKEGRTFSAANSRMILATADDLDKASTDLRALVAANQQTNDDAAKAAYLASPEARARQLRLLELAIR